MCHVGDVQQQVFRYRYVVLALFAVFATALSAAMALSGLLSPTVSVVMPIGAIFGLHRGSRIDIGPDGITVGDRKVTAWNDIAVKTNRLGVSLILGTGLFKARPALRYYERNWRHSPLASALDEHIPADATQLRSALGFAHRVSEAAPPGYVHFEAPLPQQRVM